MKKSNRWLSGSRWLALWIGAAMLAACSTPPRDAKLAEASTAVTVNPPAATPAPAAPALGTQWGEGRESRVRTVSARRISPERADDVASIGYNDAAGIRRTVGANAERQLNLSLAQGDVEWSVHDDNDRAIPLQRARRSGDMFRLAGMQGARYTLVFKNLSERSYEVVATVDGLDVLNGQPGSLRSAGYVLRPQGTLRIDGFRKSQDEVAAFRFAAPGRAYAANTEAGDVRNVGVIGAALFELDMPDVKRVPRRSATPPSPNAFPADAQPSYAPPPTYRK
ncbi:MAG TPA: hypothetical protein VE084_05850 [Burkholderiaceae bacterium]|nr:hypothetical protein [Burkholderiaceae bacterium]